MIARRLFLSRLLRQVSARAAAPAQPPSRLPPCRRGTPAGEEGSAPVLSLAAVNQCDGGGVINHPPARGRHGQLLLAATEGVCTENQARAVA